MPLVQAYQCPRTGKLFSSKYDYVSYLRGMARESLNRRAKKRRLDVMAERMAPLYRCSTIEDICQWVIDNSELVFWNAYEIRQPYGIDTPKKAAAAAEKFKILTFDLDVRYSDCCSNSHAAPEGKPTNWCNQDKSLPNGYPGMEGKFKYTTENEIPSGLCFEVLKAMKMHIETASGHVRSAGGDLKLFGEEWPALCVRHVLETLE